MRLLAAPLLALGMATVFGMGTAGSAPLPTVTVDPGYGPPLTTVKVVGRSFCTACGPVTLSVSALNVDTAPVRADGSFSHLVRIPGSTRPGTVTIAASQGSSTARTSFTVTVYQPAPKTYSPPKTVPAPGNLPSVSVPGTPNRSSTPAAPTQTPPATVSPQPSSSTTGPNVSIAPSAGPTVADRPASASSPDRPIGTLAVVAALLAAGGGGLWWLRRRRAAPGG